jgi:hypothetical protein
MSLSIESCVPTVAGARAIVPRGLRIASRSLAVHVFRGTPGRSTTSHNLVSDGVHRRRPHRTPRSRSNAWGHSGGLGSIPRREFWWVTAGGIRDFVPVDGQQAARPTPMLPVSPIFLGRRRARIAGGHPHRHSSLQRRDGFSWWTERPTRPLGSGAVHSCASEDGTFRRGSPVGARAPAALAHHRPRRRQ